MESVEERLSFVDVGVYKGHTSKSLLRMTDSPSLAIHMFEPNPPFAENLRKIKDERVTVYEEALMNYNGRANLKIPYSIKTGQAKWQGASLLSREKTQPKWRFELLDVATRSARDFISELPPGPVVLYCNCEGGEYAIVRDLFLDDTWKRISLWSIQLHDQKKMDNIKEEYYNLLATFKKFKIRNPTGEFSGNRRDDRMRKFLRREVLPLIP